jgi:hypothetical protein
MQSVVLALISLLLIASFTILLLKLREGESNGESFPLQHQFPKPPSEGNVRGVFSLTHGKLPSSDVLELDYVDGLSVRIYWRDIEKDERVFDWSFFDQAVEMAMVSGKKLFLRAIDGAGTPQWVWDAGAQWYLFENNKVPVPWDKIFLEKWGNFIKIFGQRYNKEPTVTLIAMCCPGGLWAELSLPVVLRNRADYNYSKVLEDHKRVIDFYAESFPEKSISLAISGHGPLVYLDNDLTDYIVNKFGNWSTRFYTQANGLSEIGVMGAPSDEVEISYYPMWEKPIRRGFQMIGANSWTNGPRCGDIRRCISVAVGYGGTFVEIYEDDIQNQLYTNDIRYAYETMKNP